MASPSNQTPRAQFATFADLLRIPEEQRFHEILDGEVLRKAMPGGEHSLVHGSVRGALSGFQGKPNGASRPGGWWLLVEPTIELARHEVVQPDLAGWLRTRMPERPSGYPLKLRPDWICEIMTDGDARRRDGLRKRRIYADYGIPHYWLLDAEREVLTVLRLEDEGYVEQLVAGRAKTVHAEPFAAIALSIGELLGYDPE